MGQLSEQAVRKKSKPFIVEMDTKKYVYRTDVHCIATYTL